MSLSQRASRNLLADVIETFAVNTRHDFERLMLSFKNDESDKELLATAQRAINRAEVTGAIAVAELANQIAHDARAGSTLARLDATIIRLNAEVDRYVALVRAIYLFGDADVR
ncbi:MAG: hypothetical protein AAF098_10900 [Pseudomonadota bacterium]